MPSFSNINPPLKFPVSDDKVIAPFLPLETSPELISFTTASVINFLPSSFRTSFSSPATPDERIVSLTKAMYRSPSNLQSSSILFSKTSFIITCFALSFHF